MSVYDNSAYNAYPNGSAHTLGSNYYVASAAPVSSGLGYYGAQQYAAPAAPAQAPFQLDEQLNAEIETRLVTIGQRRAPVLRRQIIRVPGPAGRVQQVVRRLPTPQPDVIERVVVSKPQRDVINLLIERPGTPPPQVQERRVVARAHKPTITQQIVRVAPRTQAPPPAPVAVQQVQPVYQPIAVQPVVYQPSVYQPVSYQPYTAANYGYDSVSTYSGVGVAQQQPALSGYYAPQASYAYPYSGYGY